MKKFERNWVLVKKELLLKQILKSYLRLREMLFMKLLWIRSKKELKFMKRKNKMDPNKTFLLDPNGFPILSLVKRKELVLPSMDLKLKS